MPKDFDLGNTETCSLRVASPIRLVERALSPLITLFDRITRVMNAYISGDASIEKPYTDWREGVTESRRPFSGLDTRSRT